jgi:hypothetical protein
MRININKHKPKSVGKAGKECVCRVRNRAVRMTPEEIVRQAVIGWYIDEKGIPIERIDVEVKRADVVVYDDNDEPIFVLECKREDELLTADAVDQLIDYTLDIPANVAAITNGVEMYVFLRCEHNYVPLKKVPSYEELLNPSGLEQYTEEESPAWIRPSFEKISYPEFREKLNKQLVCIGEDTPERLHRFVVNLCCFFWDESDKMPPQDVHGMHVEDLGVKFWAPGNPSGGQKWPGEYRVFRVESWQDELDAGITIRAGEKYVDDPQYKNRKGRTNLLVAIYDSNKPHNSLQLPLDKEGNLIVRGTRYTILHDGTMSGRRKNEVITYIQQQVPRLVRPDGYVILGNLDDSENITWQQEGVKQFVVNLIQYALLRDEYKNR